MKKTVQNIDQFHTEITKNSEFFHTLLNIPNAKIELIESCSVENGELYNQDHDEWVIVLEGKATLQIQNDLYDLKKGDFLFIQKGTLHRVVATGQKTLWLALHLY